ncbi:hypothetical protein DPMN_142078 [Dreissena polymorpha]|uniref:Uncharacterized protein n=1 Tax=Dreissena polymorpha TaxID=45954 RepID=A0A9D4GDW6_DREPO|nr:hypothetical protein DPMN_142078 [Dreissena polymorpha]
MFCNKDEVYHSRLRTWKRDSVWGVILPVEACLGDDVEPVVLIVLRAPTLWLAVSGANSLLSASDQVTP